MLNNSAVFQNGELITVFPKGSSINDLNILSYKENEGYFQSSLTIDALFLNCQTMGSKKFEDAKFWVNPIFENEDGVTQSINYTISFINQTEDKSAVYLIAVIALFITGLMSIICLSVYTMGKVRELKVELAQEMAVFQKNKEQFKKRRGSSMHDSVMDRLEGLKNPKFVKVVSRGNLEPSSGKK